jgi:hypothetical protein
MMRAIALALVCGACTDPIVQMDVKVETVDNMDLSCVGALIADGDGKNRGTTTQQPDDTRSCIPVSGLTSMTDVPGLLRGKVTLGIPGSGLIGVEVSGTTGTCDASGVDVFYGGARYDGQDNLTVTLVPQVSCAHEPLRIRPVDLFALTLDPQHNCPPAIQLGPSSSTGVRYGVVEQTLFDGPRGQFGSLNLLNNGVITVDDYTPINNPGSCLSAAFTEGIDGKLSADGCLRFSPNTVCAQPNELEVAAINSILVANLYQQSPDARFHDLVVGAVWGIDSAGSKTPLEGATVTVDPSKGRVVFADLATVDTTPALDLTATTAKGSGLFVVYTNEYVDLQVSAPGYTPETVHVAPVDGQSDSTVLVALKLQ